MSPTYVLAAGGTGGHLFPAEAVARLLVDHGGAVHLLTDQRADAFAASVPGVTIDLVRAGRFGGGPLHAAYGLAELAVGVPLQPLEEHHLPRMFADECLRLFRVGILQRLPPLGP